MPPEFLHILTSPRTHQTLTELKQWSYGEVMQMVDWLDELDEAEAKAQRKAQREAERTQRR